MATYKAYLFNMITDNGSYIELEQGKNSLFVAVVIKAPFHGKELYRQVSFKNMGTLQNFILLNSDKRLTNEQLVNKLAYILYINEVKHYE